MTIFTAEMISRNVFCTMNRVWLPSFMGTTIKEPPSSMEGAR